VTRRPHAAVAAAAAATLAVACSTSNDSAGATGEVRVKLLAFAPTPLRVKAGTTVTWTDDEPVTHTVTSGTVTGVDAATGLRAGETPDGVFDGRLAGAGATFSHRFTEAGEFSYFCSIHKGMNATVTVTR
jgi:plastocyanin